MIRDSIPINLIPAGTSVVASGTGTPVTGLKGLVNFYALLRVSVANATSLDVYIQTATQTQDGAAVVWNDIAHFTQVLTSTGNWYVQVASDVIPGTPAGPVKDATLAVATTLQGPWGDQLRAKWVAVGVGPWTVALDAYLK